MTNRDLAQSVDYGLIIDENNDGPFITGGIASPAGLDLPEGTIYFRNLTGGFELWDKQGPLATDWKIKEFVAKALITEFFNNNAVQSTTVTLPGYANALTANTQSLEVGDYLVQWGLEYTNDANNRDSAFRVVAGGVEIASEEKTFPSGGIYETRSGIYLASGISGVQTFTIDFARLNQGSALIRRIVIGYIRVG